jgi:transcriptional regulator with XRE-family HTH domain
MKTLLRIRGKTQTWLAHQLGVHHVTVSNWVRGIYSPDNDTVRRIAGLLQCEPEEIVGGIPPMTDEERRHLSNFRALPPDARAIIEQMTNVLLANQPAHQEESDLAPPAKKSD